ncbi:MAG: type II toxin-antitoxin system VapC family toxin, partial [Actinomycetota bacterium]
MKLVDANVLLYAVNTDAERHEPSRRWLDGALS